MLSVRMSSESHADGQSSRCRVAQSESIAPSLGPGMSRTKSLFSISSSTVSTSSDSLTEGETQSEQFGQEVRDYTQGIPHPSIDSGLRKVMEPYLRRARLTRERRRNPTHLNVDASIAGSVGVPYTSLRHEMPFLFDTHSYQIHKILADALGVNDLSQVHKINNDDVLKPLLDPHVRHAFHSTYDGFVTSFCIPLLHSVALAKNVFHTSSGRIIYRYQAFPSIRIVRPGGTAMAPTCNLAAGHSIGCLTFHVPLTPSFGTNALYTESHLGREDWHPLQAKSIGLGYLFDGARCLHFEMENTTSASRVSIDFCIMMYREQPSSSRHGGAGTNTTNNIQSTTADNSGLCPLELIEDNFSRADPRYYDEAFIDQSLPAAHHDVASNVFVVKKNGNTTLLQPSKQLGSPFVQH